MDFHDMTVNLIEGNRWGVFLQISHQFIPSAWQGLSIVIFKPYSPDRLELFPGCCGAKRMRVYDSLWMVEPLHCRVASTTSSGIHTQLGELTGSM